MGWKRDLEDANQALGSQFQNSNDNKTPIDIAFSLFCSWSHCHEKQSAKRASGFLWHYFMEWSRDSTLALAAEGSAMPDQGLGVSDVVVFVGLLWLMFLCC